MNIIRRKKLRVVKSRICLALEKNIIVEEYEGKWILSCDGLGYAIKLGWTNHNRSKFDTEYEAESYLSDNLDTLYKDLSYVLDTEKSK
jgi:hypothetical protein